MLRGSEITIINIVLDTKSMVSLNMLFSAVLLLSLVPFLFILPLQGRYKGGWKKMRHRLLSRAPKQKNMEMRNSEYQDAHQDFYEDDNQHERRQNPFNLQTANPDQLTLADIMGFTINGWDEQSTESRDEYYSSFELGCNPTDKKSQISNPNPNPNPNKPTLGEVLGHIGKKNHRRRWLVSALKGVAKFSTSRRRSQTKKKLIMAPPSKSTYHVLGDQDGTQAEPTEPLIELQDGLDELDEPRQEKTDQVCRMCMIRNKDATLIPCCHAYCRVCSREIWINRGCCPICDLRIVEVVDMC